MELVFGAEYNGKQFGTVEAALKEMQENMRRRTNMIPAQMRTELLAYLKRVSKEVADRHGRPWPGGTGPDRLSARSGRLQEALRTSPRITVDTPSHLEGRITLPYYAAVQEFGGVIRVKNANYLTIPLPAALNPNGTPKRPSARSWDNTFVRRSKKGNLLIYQTRGRTIVPLYKLVKEVKIPKRLGMREALAKHAPQFSRDFLRSIIREFA